MICLEMMTATIFWSFEKKEIEFHNYHVWLCRWDLIIFFCFNVQVPKEWKLDPEWDGEAKHPQELSHFRRFPSKWRAVTAHQDPVHTVRIVDHFVIHRTENIDCDTTSNGPVQ